MQALLLDNHINFAEGGRAFDRAPKGSRQSEVLIPGPSEPVNYIFFFFDHPEINR